MNENNQKNVITFGEDVESVLKTLEDKLFPTSEEKKAKISIKQEKILNIIKSIKDEVYPFYYSAEEALEVFRNSNISVNKEDIFLCSYRRKDVIANRRVSWGVIKDEMLFDVDVLETGHCQPVLRDEKLDGLFFDKYTPNKNGTYSFLLSKEDCIKRLQDFYGIKLEEKDMVYGIKYIQDEEYQYHIMSPVIGAFSDIVEYNKKKAPEVYKDTEICEVFIGINPLTGDMTEYFKGHTEVKPQYGINVIFFNMWY